MNAARSFLAVLTVFITTLKKGVMLALYRQTHMILYRLVQAINENTASRALNGEELKAHTHTQHQLSPGLRACSGSTVRVRTCPTSNDAITIRK